MLEWMIAITAVCGAISGLAILYFALRAALHMRSELGGARKGARVVRGHVDTTGDEILPRATVHRVSPTLGLVRRSTGAARITKIAAA